MLKRILLFGITFMIPYLSLSMPRHPRVSEQINLGETSQSDMNLIL